MTLPRVRIGSLEISRLLVGGNPFSGISHQSPERDRQMMDYYTAECIKQTLRECEAVGINSAILRADAHIWRLLREYWNEGGRIQWIAQTAPEYGDQYANIDRAVAHGASAVFLQGLVTERLYTEGRMDGIADLVAHIRRCGLPAGVAAHAPEVHLAVRDAGIPVDFHMVCFYDCGSVHVDRGEQFDPADPPRAVAAIQAISRPCIAYKVLAAGRVPAREALPYAFAHIKPTDAVVVGVYTRDDPGMVQENAALAVKSCAAPSPLANLWAHPDVS